MAFLRASVARTLLTLALVSAAASAIAAAVAWVLLLG
jgi:hypothetical protein